ncbi:MAG: DUF3237 domain-containing protein [Spongiibacteraceae bacterium]|jgi:hypothetical protein|nr:DUF3237 domain-containing protein [Spongiibacteraceae bacterium]
MRELNYNNMLPGVSEGGEPKMHFCFEIALTFPKTHTIPDTPSGCGRGAVFVEEGVISGPMLNGRVVPYSGGDYALFRPDGTLELNARYLLEAEDGTEIFMQNRGFLWGRYKDSLDKIKAWMFEGGPEVSHDEYYLRANPVFEVTSGKYDWLTRYVFVGIGSRQKLGNTIRYYALL